MIYAVPPRLTAQQRETKELVLYVRDTFVAALRDKAQIDAFLKDPESKQIVDSTVSWLANGWSPGRIATITGLHVDLVRRIRDEHPEAIANLKLTIATQLGETVQLLAERMLRSIDDIAPDKLPAALSQILDKYQLMSGGVTARFEHRNVATPEDLERMFNALPTAKARVIQDKDNGNGH